MYDDRINWCTKESAHFIFKYPSNTIIENDIEVIIQKRESAYENISAFLGVEADRKLVLYFSPSYEFCQQYKMVAQAAVPHQYFASLVYDDFPFGTEKINHGHEITHLLSYFWDRKRYHLEILEEGLAVYLDQSGNNHHIDYLNLLKSQICHKAIDFSLDVKAYCRTTNHKKAASFVKFLTEEYGLEKFRDLYLSSSIERNGYVFYVNGKVLPSDFLRKLLKKCFHKGAEFIQNQWVEVLGFIF